MESPVDFDVEKNYIIYGTFHMKRAEYKELQKQVVVALFGRPANGTSNAVPAQLQVFKGSHNPQSPSSRLPNYSINLENATITVVPMAKKKTASYYNFSLIDAEGISYEFRTVHECDYKVWMNRLKFLTKFPYSSIPDSLRYNHPIGFDKDLDAKLYNADSVWPVYILPEEIGSRCSITGPKVLALHSQSKTSSKGKLKIYDLGDHNNPVMSCNHDTIRRTGMLGLFLYFELGTRCRGGPGLLWMNFGSNKEDGIWMKEVLYEFLLRQHVLPQRSPNVIHPEPQYNKTHRSSVPTILPSWQQGKQHARKQKKHEYQEVELKPSPQQPKQVQPYTPPKYSPSGKDSIQPSWKHCTQQQQPCISGRSGHQYEFISTAWKKKDTKKQRSLSESTSSSNWRHSYNTLESMLPPLQSHSYRQEKESTHQHRLILESKPPPRQHDMRKEQNYAPDSPPPSQRHDYSELERTSFSWEHTDYELKPTSPSHDYSELEPSRELKPTSPSHDYEPSRKLKPSHDCSELEPSHELKPTSPSHDYSELEPLCELKPTSPSHDYRKLEPPLPYHELEPPIPPRQYSELEAASPSHDYRELELPISPSELLELELPIPPRKLEPTSLLSQDECSDTPLEEDEYSKLNHFHKSQ